MGTSMNDFPQTVVPAPQPGTPAPAPAGTDDFGAALRAAREAAGISTATLAGRLRLHVKQIEALERSDLAALPTLIYVRGFVRSCARELRIDAQPLLAALDRRAGVQPGVPLPPSPGPFPLARLGDGSRAIVVLTLFVLVLAGIVGSLWPRNRTPTPVATLAPASAPSATAAAAPAAAAPPEGSVPSPGSPANPVPAPAPAAPAVSGATAAVTGVVPAKPAAPMATVTTTAPGNRAPPLKASVPEHVAAAPEAVVPPVPAPAAAAVPEAPAALAATAAGELPALTLRVHAASWIEIVQANGNTVFSQICPAGSVQTVRAAPPLRLVIGNAAAVEAQYQGQNVDLNHYANANGVARFTLN